MLRPSGVSIGKRGKLRRLGERFLGHAGRRNELRGLTVAEGDGARFVEQQHIHIAGRLHGPAAHREHVLLHQSIDAGDADRAQQAADGRWDEADEQCDQHGDRKLDVLVNAERLLRHEHDEENDRERGKENGEGDFVGRLLAFGAFDQTDHPIEEGFTGILAVIRILITSERTRVQRP